MPDFLIAAFLIFSLIEVAWLAVFYVAMRRWPRGWEWFPGNPRMPHG